MCPSRRGSTGSPSTRRSRPAAASACASCPPSSAAWACRRPAPIPCCTRTSAPWSPSCAAYRPSRRPRSCSATTTATPIARSHRPSGSRSARSASASRTRSQRSASGSKRRSAPTDRSTLGRVRDFLREGKLITLMIGHLTVDSYAGIIPVLYPLLIGRYALNFATVGLISLAYSGTAAVSQPLFGIVADRHGTRLTGARRAWAAVTFALVGFAPTFPLLIAVACLSGLGSGAFHPFGALDVRALLPKRSGSTGMSIYVTAGTVGVALGPLIGIAVFGLFGLHGTRLLLIPGGVTGAYLLWR